MSYKSDFENATGWNVVDTNINLDNAKGVTFRNYLKANNVSTIIRYYASTQRSKTLTVNEARALSADGFNLLPVYQDRNREVEDFGATNGKYSAQNALAFANRIGQPAGSTILFAVDADFTPSETNAYIVPYFEAIKTNLGGQFKIGAYAGGHVLQRLMNLGLIEIPWISMSRGFTGTEPFFYSNDWFLRQVPPAKVHPGTGVTYDRDIANRPISELGVFRVDTAGAGQLVAAAFDLEDAVLGGLLAAVPSGPIPVAGRRTQQPHQPADSRTSPPRA